MAAYGQDDVYPSEASKQEAAAEEAKAAQDKAAAASSAPEGENKASADAKQWQDPAPHKPLYDLMLILMEVGSAAHLLPPGVDRLSAGVLCRRAPWPWLRAERLCCYAVRRRRWRSGSMTCAPPQWVSATLALLARFVALALTLRCFRLHADTPRQGEPHKQDGNYHRRLQVDTAKATAAEQVTRLRLFAHVRSCGVRFLITCA